MGGIALPINVFIKAPTLVPWPMSTRVGVLDSLGSQGWIVSEAFHWRHGRRWSSFRRIWTFVRAQYVQYELEKLLQSLKRERYVVPCQTMHLKERALYIRQRRENIDSLFVLLPSMLWLFGCRGEDDRVPSEIEVTLGSLHYSSALSAIPQQIAAMQCSWVCNWWNLLSSMDSNTVSKEIKVLIQYGKLTYL